MSVAATHVLEKSIMLFFLMFFYCGKSHIIENILF